MLRNHELPRNASTADAKAHTMNETYGYSGSDCKLGIEPLTDVPPLRRTPELQL